MADKPIIRRTMIPVSDCVGEARVRRYLPPEHRIVAIRPDPTRGLTDYLVEGPLVPDAAEVVPVLTMTLLEPDKVRVRLIGRWETDDEEWVIGEWVIGEWPSVDAYREEMEALDG